MAKITEGYTGYMDEQEIQSILTELLYCVINGIESDTALNGKLTSEVLTSVYRLAKKHSLAHLVARYVYSSKIEAEPTLKAKLHQNDLAAVCGYERMKYVYGQVCEIFEKNEIAYIPLKGAVLRAYYPTEDMRTSCDIDILIKEEALDTAVSMLKEAGFQGGERHYHDVSLYAPDGTHLELHFSLQENIDTLDAVLQDAWNYAAPIEGYRYGFDKAFFVFYTYAHMSYHFLSGGCGMRSLLDVWVMEQKMDAPYACAETLLQQAGIYRFAMEMSKLANRCFTQRNGVDPVLKYIWRGGVYGSSKNKMAVKKEREGTFSYVLRKTFPPYKTMAMSYPSLRKCAILLPFCWMHRGVKAIFKGKTARLAAEIADSNRLAEEELLEVKEVVSRLGL